MLFKNKTSQHVHTVKTTPCHCQYITLFYKNTQRTNILNNTQNYIKHILIITHVCHLISRVFIIQTI